MTPYFLSCELVEMPLLCMLQQKQKQKAVKTIKKYLLTVSTG